MQFSIARVPALARTESNPPQLDTPAAAHTPGWARTGSSPPERFDAASADDHPSINRLRAPRAAASHESATMPDMTARTAATSVDGRCPPLASFSDYVAGMAVLLQSPVRDQVDGALDGAVSAQLRATLSLKERREAGAFFTSHELAEAMLRGVDLRAKPAPILDPACGAGDLLLAAAKRLPVRRSAQATLELWGQVLEGCDLDATYVRLARIRLGLLAGKLTRSAEPMDESTLEALLPSIRQSDGRGAMPKSPVTILMNPPFGNTVVASTAWGSTGTLSRAADFTADIIDSAPHGSWIYAILPDVLRSGTRYQGWRAHVQQRLRLTKVQPVGRFDPWADIDVIFLRGRRRDSDRAPLSPFWSTKSVPEIPGRVGDQFEVRVGTVVPHRHHDTGASSPYLTAKDLPTQGEYRAGEITRSHEGRRFSSPFVAVRRTSRPTSSDNKPRIIANVITSADPVLVENHLLVCAPKSGSVEDCRRLVRQLRTPVVTAWLNRRIRCRHLTVGALREAPFIWVD